MRLLSFIIVSFITITITILLNLRINDLPPLGKFLDPFSGFWHNSALIEDMPTELQLEGLKETVTITYDKNLIPYIFAKNEEDLYFAQGYVIASHRLWQMEIITHFAAGRLSEIFGDSHLDTDRFTRRKGLPYGARNAYEAMLKDSVLFPLVESFSKGVNAYISALEYRSYPIEYKLLHYQPEEWSPYKTALLLKYMADNLSRTEHDLQNTNALNLFGKDTFDIFFPERYSSNAPIIPKGTKWGFRSLKKDQADPEYFKKSINSDYPQPNPDNGSNNWAVNAGKTAGGAPILANDIHLDLNLPGIWFLMQLSTPDMRVFGGTLPGALGVITGFNDSIAWGVTNAKQDVVDWYRIKFKDQYKESYLYGDEWLNTEKIVEEFKVRDQGVFYDTILFTHLGPVVFDDHYQPENGLKDFAMRWTAHDSSLEQKTFYLINKAKNFQEYTNALNYYDAPAQNFIFASKKREIAIKVTGKFPLKWPGQGKFLMDGSNPVHEWKEFVPKEHLPQSYNPSTGFLFSANQYPVDSLYPYYVYDHHYEHFRNRRLQERLSAMTRITPVDMMRLQNDNFNYKAFLSLQFLLLKMDTLAFNEKENENFQILKNWDYMSDANKKAPAIYEMWWSIITNKLWDEFDRNDIVLSKPNDNTTISLIKKYENLPIYDIRETPEVENLKGIIKKSFTITTDSIDRWETSTGQTYLWGDYKSTNIMHLLGLSSLSHENVMVGGGRNIINANSGKHGVSLRIVTELQQNSKCWVIYPGGQSGHPGSPFYDNLINLWRDGKYLEVQLMDLPEDQNSDYFIQKLQPD